MTQSSRSHIFLSEDDPISLWNGPILYITQVIKFVMTSAAEAELAAVYITAQKLVPMRQTLIEMGWPQPTTPIQIDNSKSEGVVNNKIVTKTIKSMELRLYWLLCREAQKQFRFYWDKGPNNWGDFHTKQNPPVYHEAKLPFFEGCTHILLHVLRAQRRGTQ